MSHTHRRGEAGNIIIALTVFLMLLLCFVAFGTEAGRWYLLRAEISKAVDAGALAGARNISNPYVDARTLASEFCAENFPAGGFGTPSAGTGSATFNVALEPDDRISVDGHATAPAIMSQLLGIHDVPVSSAGIAQMRPVEIMMVLDRSGSMAGQPMADLKVAARSFVDFFDDSQNRDKMGLISFATSVSVDRSLSTNFVTPIKTAITNLNAASYTNAEDAIDQADGPQGFTDQNGIPAGSRVQQFLVFFSDGRPNTFKWLFRRQGVNYVALANVEDNCDPGGSHPVNGALLNPVNGAQMISSRPTGDGVSRCSGQYSTRWYIFDQRPVPGYSPMACSIPSQALGDHACNLAAALAVDKARTLKDKDITVFAIGLGDRINRSFLESIASGPEMVYVAPNSAELQTIFQKVAQDIKLRLVQ
ncbi:MAG TPA: VWA domain-containing protein [Candidatus Eisenbacteria bacterium]|nr:VWA domain-containing protein [Candidatus Eisenbacteria bacterium]